MPYDAGAQRLVESHNGTDCSGAVYRALRARGINPGPNATSESLEVWARSNGGREIPVADALRIPGAGLFIWGIGPDGHVAESRGDGTTWETPAWGPYGHALGIGNASAHRWTGAVLWPGIDYAGHVPSSSSAPPLTRLLKIGCAGADVHACQLRLIHWEHLTHDAGLDPGAPDGIYGAHTAHAVRGFQSREHLGVDGIVGPITWAALWRS